MWPQFLTLFSEYLWKCLWRAPLKLFSLIRIRCSFGAIALQFLSNQWVVWNSWCRLQHTTNQIEVAFTPCEQPLSEIKSWKSFWKNIGSNQSFWWEGGVEWKRCFSPGVVSFTDPLHYWKTTISATLIEVYEGSYTSDKRSFLIAIKFNAMSLSLFSSNVLT